VRMAYEDEIFYSNTGSGDFRDDEPRYGLPKMHQIKGPEPDVFVWMGLFLGREVEETSRKKHARDQRNGNICFEDGNRFSSIWKNPWYRNPRNDEEHSSISCHGGRKASTSGCSNFAQCMGSAVLWKMY